MLTRDWLKGYLKLYNPNLTPRVPSAKKQARKIKLALKRISDK